MNYYEHTYIASQSLNNKDLLDLHQKVEDLIKKNKGKIEKKEDWGLRQLAYPIKHFKKGYYMNLYFSGEPAVVHELEKIERIEANILRFMTIRIKNIPEDNSELLVKNESK
jgi:small subunit ribosomal protein S6